MALRNARHAVDQLSGNLVPAMYGNPDMENYALVGASKDWESSDDSYLSEDRLAFAYSLFYVYYDQYDSIRGIAIQNLLLSFAVVFFAIELITNLYASAIVTMLVAGTTWALIGLCYVWNKLGGHYETEVNAVSVVNLVMCVGLAVEFSIHIMTSFLK